jgi:hypothetical protein
VTGKEDAFLLEVQALEEYDRRQWLPRFKGLQPTYTELAAYFREVARRAMVCSYLAEEAAREVGEGRTRVPALESE